VRVDGVRVRYVEAGAEHGGVPLVIVHGYNGSCDYWYPQTVLGLAEGRHVIAVDLPGNGLSAKLPAHTTQTLRDFIVRFVEVLGYEQADLMGHSMGGFLVVAAALARPERVRSLVLVDSAGLPDLVKHMWLVPVVALADSSMRQWRFYPTFIKIGMRARAKRECLDMIRKHSMREALHKLNLPVFILWGEKDRVVPVEHGYYMAEHIPGARLTVVKGVGHMPFYEKPAECNELILDFIKGLERQQ
jgi:pyruvate dehydrogenase E2 component (dihydrolipoamide acetyltransferase)